MNPFYIKNAIILLIFASIFFSSCKTKPSAPSNQPPTSCKTTGTVKDFTGLDGCKFLIILHDGTKLLPAKVADRRFKFRDGQNIRFDYIIPKDPGMSICMTEDHIVEITCIQEVGVDAQIDSSCTFTANAVEVEWINTLIENYRSFRVVRYDFVDEYLYFFQGPNSYLHNCRGEVVCHVPGKMMNDCYAQIQSLTGEHVIWIKQ